jgi:hypothetical protein
MTKFYAEKHTLYTLDKYPWVLFGISIQGQVKYFKEITIYFLKWEFTFGYDWQDQSADDDGEV